MTTVTRAERSARNKLAHSIRRRLTDADYREARAAGAGMSWLELADAYANMTNDYVISTFGTVLEAPAAPATAPAAPAAPAAKRTAPAHVLEAKANYRAARDAWEDKLADAMGGGHAPGDRPTRDTRGEDKRYQQEERDFRAAHPAPVYRDFLRDVAARMRAERESLELAGGAA